MNENEQENNNISLGGRKARGLPNGVFGCVLSKKSKKGENFLSAGSTSLKKPPVSWRKNLPKLLRVQ